MRTIKIKATGVETVVSEEYFKAYESAGWFIEILPEPVEIMILPEPKSTKKKAEPKE